MAVGLPLGAFCVRLTFMQSIFKVRRCESRREWISVINGSDVWHLKRDVGYRLWCPLWCLVSPQFWPHVCLPLEQVGREYAFGDLDLRLLTAGELEIITGDTVSAVEKEGRLTLLKDLTYIAGSHGWQTAKNVYSAVLRRIELGTLQWDRDFSAIKQAVLLKPTATNNVSKFGVKKPSRGSFSPNAWYCHAF